MASGSDDRRDAYTVHAMTMRSCTDHAGARWEIFEVHPGVERRSNGRMPEAFLAGWLCFQSPTERRRLAPIPLDWTEWTERELLAALEQGRRSDRRTPIGLRQLPDLGESRDQRV